VKKLAYNAKIERAFMLGEYRQFACSIEYGQFLAFLLSIENIPNAVASIIIERYKSLGTKKSQLRT